MAEVHLCARSHDKQSKGKEWREEKPLTEGE